MKAQSKQLLNGAPSVLDLINHTTCPSPQYLGPLQVWYKITDINRQDVELFTICASMCSKMD
jgi:hypothetical protein